MVNVNELVEELEKNLGLLDGNVSGDLALVQFFTTTHTVQNDSITPLALDAYGGPIKDIVVDFFLNADAGVTNVTPSVHKTREAAPVTFTQEVVPAITPLAQPGLATDSRYRYKCGDLPENGQFEFRVAQTNDGKPGIIIDLVLTCWMKP